MVFDARRTYAYEDDGRVGYVALEVGASTVAIGFEPGAGPPEAALWIYVDDVDPAFERALERGATAVEEPALMPWCERVGQVRDPDGMLLYLGAEASGAEGSGLEASGADASVAAASEAAAT